MKFLWINVNNNFNFNINYLEEEKNIGNNEYLKTAINYNK